MNKFNLQMILEHEYDDFINKAHLSFNQIKVFNHILRCHTVDMGFNSYHCENCDFKVIHYNSCRDRNCNMCQGVQREEWIEKYEERLLPVPYFHIVFTLPDILNPIIYQNQKVLYSLMFKAASEALMKATEKNYGKIGFTFILHTWGQNLSYHPHIHCIAAGGGLTTDKEGNQIFKKAPSNYLAPIKVLSELFKGKFMDGLKKAKLGFYKDCEKYSNPDEFNALVSDAYSKDWVVYIKKPFNNNKAVLNYIGRYSHRVAISNSRITDYDEVNHTVSFSYKDYKDQSKVKIMTLSAYEFLRRYSMHILPPNFMKIRHYGFMSNTVRNKLIPICRKLLNIPASVVAAVSKGSKKASKECKCPKCGGKLILFDFAFASPLHIEQNTS